jgi:cytidylate kinase
MKLPIVIIGPMCSGKTTIAKLLAERLAVPRYSLDSLRWYYYAKNHMDLIKDEKLKSGDFENLLKFRKPYDLYTIENVLKEFRDGILEFGASHSFWEEEKKLEKVKKMIKNINKVILLLPTEDNKANIKILNDRLTQRNKEKDIEEIKKVNEKMILCGSNTKLANLIVYTEGMNPDQVVSYLVSKIK